MECPRPGLWASGLQHLNSPPLVSEIIAKLDVHAGAGERLEIGTRAGGSALLRMTYAEPGDVLVTVDPYGAKPFHGGPGLYGDDIEQEAMCLLALAAQRHGFRWQHWRMLSTDFLHHVGPLGYWLDGKHHEYEWRCAFLDGDHMSPVVIEEIAMVARNLHPRGSIIVDNANHHQPNGSHQDAIQLAANSNGLQCRFYDVGDGDVIAVLSMEDVPAIIGLEPMAVV